MVWLLFACSCGESVCKPLDIICKTWLESGWEKADVAPVYKKGDKQTIKNVRSLSVLPICGKIFEHMLYNNMTGFLAESNLISPY